MKGCVKVRLDSDLLATCCFRRFFYSMFRDSNVIDKGINKKRTRLFKRERRASRLELIDHNTSAIGIVVRRVIIGARRERVVR